jgi:hypothetical protein
MKFKNTISENYEGNRRWQSEASQAAIAPGNPALVVPIPMPT